METTRRRVALVTGGAVGIGQAIARRLAADDVAVAIGYHERPADETVAAVTADGGTALAVHLDVTRPTDIGAAVETVLRQLGGIDILVNNAGGLLARIPIEVMPDDHWQRVVDLNLTGAFRCIRAVAPRLESGGRIINVSSLAAQNGGGPGAGAYAAAKAGLIGLTRAAAKELGGRGITVNAVAPGFIADTPFHATFSSPAAQQAMIEGSALGRGGLPTDVAAAVAFLASDEASFLTGAVIDCNGGSYFT